jgi:DNA-binding Lrp family transcriptional regulator
MWGGGSVYSDKLDKIDREIIEILTKYGRISYAELAKMVRRSPSAVKKRIEKMLRDDLIERFTVVLNTKKMGKGITATLTVHPASRRMRRISEYIVKMSYVAEAYHMTGKCGILAIVQVGDIEELNDCIQEIQGLEGVLDVDACVALKKIK